MLGRVGPGLLGPVARTAVVAGTATAVSKGVARRQERKYAEQDAAAEQQRLAADGGDRVALSEADYTAELQRLAELKAAGIITQDEFDAKKKQILGI